MLWACIACKVLLPVHRTSGNGPDEPNTLPTVASSTTYVVRNEIFLVFVNASVPNTISDVVVSDEECKQ